MIRRTATLVVAYVALMVACMVYIVATAEGSPGAAWTSSRASAYSPSDSPGRLACTGESLTWSSKVVAHRTLACGTRIRICTGRGVCVTTRVADRGPFIAGRDLDLAPGAYAALGYRSAGDWGVRWVSWRVLG